MKGDFTRRTFNPRKHYSSVQMQQGRVQLDSDWNEEVAILDHRWRATLEDVVGPNGSPKAGGGFAITAVAGPDGEDLLLTPGRLYVDGILCEIDAAWLDGTVVDPTTGTVHVGGSVVGETALAAHLWVQVSDSTGKPISKAMISSVAAPTGGSTDWTLTLVSVVDGALPAANTSVRVSPVVTYLTQPDLPSPIPIDTQTEDTYFGPTYIAYLDVFQRHITAIDDPAIREVALNGPDTGTRTRTTWQVRVVEVEDLTTCADVVLPAMAPPSSEKFPPPVAGTGRMRAHAVPSSDPQKDCLLPAEAGFRRLENQLYRVEIHDAGDYSTATFKWSRDNGSVVVAWVDARKAGELQIAGTPQDAAQGFAAGQWIELVDDVRELSPDPTVLGQFVQLTVPDGNTLTYDSTMFTVHFDQFHGHRKVRRWEGGPQKVNNVPKPGGWIQLEDGVEVQFVAGDSSTWFNKGDYWLIPARTATTDIEWPKDPPDTGEPVALRAHGVEHRYCALALIQMHAGGTVTVVDCRPHFPPLTAIEASDVSYDNSTCQLINATTVQQAIDALCKARDLAHHNRLIHGYGIVCGLQVECNASPGHWVTVKGGYAIDCNGNDIEIDDLPVDVGQLVGQLSPVPADINNTDVSLIIGLDQHAQVKVTAEAYQPPKNEVDEIFGGTLLLDYYDDCIKPIQDVVKHELDTLPGDPPITVRQELASALIDLAVQGPNPVAGQNVYISKKEHELLGSLYYALKPKLTSDTFCAQFANARPYPLDAVEPVLVHAFGAGQQTRVKWRPNSNEVYTASNGNDPTKLEPRINQFDGKAGMLLGELDPASGSTTGRIIDFTFSPDGNQIYVIFESPTSTSDTLFQVGNFNPAGWIWGQKPSTITGTRLASIEDISAGMTLLAGTAIGQGFVLIDPRQSPPSLTKVAAAQSFHASGQMAALRANPQLGRPVTLVACAMTVPTSTVQPPFYDGIRLFEVNQLNVAQVADINLAGTGSDGLVWGGAGGLAAVALYVVVGTTSRSIAAYTPNAKWETPVRTFAVDSCPIHMAADGSFLYWASQDFYTLNAIFLEKVEPVAGWQLPMQVGPVDVALSPELGLAVLNRPADSVLVVPQQVLRATPAETQTLMDRVVAYHRAAFEAYVDLLAGLIQYLKDCFCDHLLVNCARCTPRNQKLYLGVVSVRSGSVHSVCNFSGRHYLKTFPTVGYWLSLFPIVPIIGEIIELICCIVVPDFASKYSSSPHTVIPGSTPKYSLGSVFNTLLEINKLDLRAQLATMLSKFHLARNVVSVGAGFGAQPSGMFATAQPAAFPSGTSTSSAAGALVAQGVAARTQPFVPSLGPKTLGAVLDIFRTPTGPSTPVTLYESGGQVQFTTNAPPPSVTVLQQQLAVKDTQLQLVQAQLQTVTQQLADLQSFRQQVTLQLAALPVPATTAGGTPPAGAAPPAGGTLASGGGAIPPGGIAPKL